MSPGAGFVLLDVEGTTTPVDFVHSVLFPDARERVADFLARHAGEPDVARDVAGLREAHARDVAAGEAPPAWDGSSTAGAATYARWLIERDRKATPLKSLQGRIWEEGYASGRLSGPVYEDVPRALARWTAAGRAVAIFSSGSVLAQRLLFAHSDRGDLTPLVSAYFDTSSGPKREAASYRRIAATLSAAPETGLFVSDVVDELDAARAAGLATALVVRTPPGPDPAGHRTIGSFDELP